MEKYEEKPIKKVWSAKNKLARHLSIISEIESETDNLIVKTKTISFDPFSK